MRKNENLHLQWKYANMIESDAKNNTDVAENRNSKTFILETFEKRLRKFL